MRNFFNKGLLFAVVLPFAGWPSLDNLSIKDIGKGIAESTGVATGSQVDAVIEAGDKLQQASKELTAEQEYYLGRAVSAFILQKYPLYRDNAGLSRYINQIGQALVARCDRPEVFGGYHFAILDSAEINALSAPGGKVFVSRGLLDLAPHEEALAAILAHEIGHVVLGHGVKAISQAKVTEAFSILGKEAVSSYGPTELSAVTEVFGDSVNQVVETLMTSGYSRTQEYEADAFAANLLAKTGYAAKGLSVILDRLAQVSSSAKGGWMNTHPSAVDRKNSLKLPKQTLNPEALQVRVARYQGVTAQ